MMIGGMHPLHFDRLAYAVGAPDGAAILVGNKLVLRDAFHPDVYARSVRFHELRQGAAGAEVPGLQGAGRIRASGEMRIRRRSHHHSGGRSGARSSGHCWRMVSWTMPSKGTVTSEAPTGSLRGPASQPSTAA